MSIDNFTICGILYFLLATGFIYLIKRKPVESTSAPTMVVEERTVPATIKEPIEEKILHEIRKPNNLRKIILSILLGTIFAVSLVIIPDQQPWKSIGGLLLFIILSVIVVLIDLKTKENNWAKSGTRLLMFVIFGGLLLACVYNVNKFRMSFTERNDISWFKEYFGLSSNEVSSEFGSDAIQLLEVIKPGDRLRLIGESNFIELLTEYEGDERNTIYFSNSTGSRFVTKTILSLIYEKDDEIDFLLPGDHERIIQYQVLRSKNNAWECILQIQVK